MQPQLQRRRGFKPDADTTVVPSQIHPPAPRPPLLYLLVATSLLGTIFAFYYSDPSHTSFRSRLPATTITNHLSASSNLFPSSLPYFADKRNLFNQLFVKKAWGWTTLLWLSHVLATFFFPPTLSSRDAIQIHSNRVPVLSRQLTRWIVATAFWWILTQGTWFFGVGPSIHHRLLIATGAQCVPSALSSTSPPLGVSGVLEPGKCNGAPGEFYQGGHDVSGHTFLLIHASLLLWETIRPTILSLPIVRRQLSSASRPKLAPSPPAIYTAYATLALIVLWEWMLIMTSIYFHTPQEKISGLIFGVMGWWISSR